MKIQNIKINHYGNLSEKEIDLKNQINIIYGKNESGKSTLLSYIKNMLYGISKNKNGKEISDYERYKPWFKEEFSGRLSYSLDNGKVFEVFRDFNKKTPKIYNQNLEDISKQFNIDKKDGIQFFYDHTKVDESVFLSTIVSMQQEVKLDKTSQNILVQKIANLVGTGDDNLSYKKIIDKLSKKQVDEIGTDRTQGKPINIMKKRMQEINVLLKDLKDQKIEKEEYLRKEESLQNSILKLETEEEIFGIIEETIQKSEVEKEKINLKNNIKNQNKEKIQKLTIEKQELIKSKENVNIQTNHKGDISKGNKDNKSKSKKQFLILGLFALLFILLQLIYQFVLKNNILAYLSYGLLPIYIIYILIDNITRKSNIKVKEKEEVLKKQLQEEKVKSEILILNNKIETIEKQLLELENENKKLELEIQEIQKNIDYAIDVKIEQIKRNYPQIKIDELLEEFDLKHVRNKRNLTEEKIKIDRLELNTIQVKRKNIDNMLENIVSIQEEYKKLEEEKQELENQTMCIELTKKYMNIAYEKMKNQITPKFTENLSKNVSDISDGKYTKVSIHDEEGLIIENEYGEYIPVSRLSVGTIDQLYLSLRLSMIDEISEESMPIILDEAFAYFDENRLENILKFLVERSQKNQIIILTCTKREQEILNKLNVQYNLVEL